MRQPIPLRPDFDAAVLRLIARESKDCSAAIWMRSATIRIRKWSRRWNVSWG
jgi:hypothetical protein